MLVRLSIQRPEVIQRLFVVFTEPASSEPLDRILGGQVYRFRDDCGFSWVAPRSEVEAGYGRLRLRDAGRQQREIHLEIRREGALLRFAIPRESYEPGR